MVSFVAETGCHVFFELKSWEWLLKSDRLKTKEQLLVYRQTKKKKTPEFTGRGECEHLHEMPQTDGLMPLTHSPSFGHTHAFREAEITAQM